MSAFLVVDTKIENPEVYEEYKSLARPIAEKYGGVYRARGGAMKVFESDLWTPTRIVIIEFPDMESAEKFYNSGEYEPVRLIRRANAKCSLPLVDGA